MSCLDELAEEIIQEALKTGDLETACDLIIMRKLSKDKEITKADEEYILK